MGACPRRPRVRPRHHTRTSYRRDMKDRQDRRPTPLAPIAVGPESAAGPAGTPAFLTTARPGGPNDFGDATGVAPRSPHRLPNLQRVIPPTRCRTNRSATGPHRSLPRRPSDSRSRTDETPKLPRKSAEDTERTHAPTPASHDQTHRLHCRRTPAPNHPGPATGEQERDVTAGATVAHRRKCPPRPRASTRGTASDETPSHQQEVLDRQDTPAPSTQRGTRKR